MNIIVPDKFVFYKIKKTMYLVKFRKIIIVEVYIYKEAG